MGKPRNPQSSKEKPLEIHGAIHREVRKTDIGEEKPKER
jgi:hypothetical protein